MQTDVMECKQGKALPANLEGRSRTSQHRAGNGVSAQSAGAAYSGKWRIQCCRMAAPGLRGAQEGGSGLRVQPVARSDGVPGLLRPRPHSRTRPWHEPVGPGTPSRAFRARPRPLSARRSRPAFASHRPRKRRHCSAPLRCQPCLRCRFFPAGPAHVQGGGVALDSAILPLTVGAALCCAGAALGRLPCHTPSCDSLKVRAC